MLISSGRVVGQFVVGVVDGPDVDDEPDIIPAKGTVTFSAAVPYVPLPGAVPPVTVMTSSIVGILNDEGFLCTPDPDDPTKAGTLGLRLFANDDPAAPVKSWTWTVTYRFAVVNGTTPAIPSHSLALLSGAEVDLTTVVKVPSSPGVGVDQAFALVDRAEAAALQAAVDAAVAQQVKADADAGLFKGEKGDPGGFTNAVLLTAADNLNLVTGPGTYYWSNISVPLNAPNQYAAAMTVIGASPSNAVQEVRIRSSASRSGVFYQRAVVNNSFEATWRSFTSTRMDQTAGRAFYQWDELNNREQLIYGDTGIRDVTGLLLNGWTASKVVIFRDGRTVTLGFISLVDTDATSTVFMNAITGFKPTTTETTLVPTVLSNNPTTAAVYASSSDVRVPNKLTAGRLGPGVYTYITWRTNDTWPASLPGTAVGTIPTT